MHKIWTLIPEVKNDKGETITSRKGIANVFAEFHSKLFAETQPEEEAHESQNMEKKTNKGESCSEHVKNEIPEFTQEEVRAAIDKLKKGKASDNNGIRAEDIKTCDATTKEMIRQIFNEVLKHDDCTPATWRRIRIKVIYKKGNVEEVGNYRPICTLPALYKLFSKITNNRLYSRLHQAQSEDQGGLRHPYQTLDHLATYRLLEQKFREWDEGI